MFEAFLKTDLLSVSNFSLVCVLCSSLLTFIRLFVCARFHKIGHVLTMVSHKHHDYQLGLCLLRLMFHRSFLYICVSTALIVFADVIWCSLRCELLRLLFWCFVAAIYNLIYCFLSVTVSKQNVYRHHKKLIFSCKGRLEV